MWGVGRLGFWAPAGSWVGPPGCLCVRVWTVGLLGCQCTVPPGFWRGLKWSVGCLPGPRATGFPPVSLCGLLGLPVSPVVGFRWMGRALGVACWGCAFVWTLGPVGSGADRRAARQAGIWGLFSFPAVAGRWWAPVLPGRAWGLGSVVRRRPVSRPVGVRLLGPLVSPFVGLVVSPSVRSELVSSEVCAAGAGFLGDPPLSLGGEWGLGSGGSLADGHPLGTGVLGRAPLQVSRLGDCLQ